MEEEEEDEEKEKKGGPALLGPGEGQVGKVGRLAEQVGASVFF